MSSNGDTPIDFPLASTLNGLIVVLKQADAVRYVSVASLVSLLYTSTDWPHTIDKFLGNPSV
ncbi:hypothetical protein VKT23_009564 [Stygiomarasmius scandens]|uniref:Uncharacterized protein n=1 Tax=Marasmiellus scandens TaxID=2682957 RepID=A0ABR1JES4_9AGAR